MPRDRLGALLCLLLGPSLVGVVGCGSEDLAEGDSPTDGADEDPGAETSEGEGEETGGPAALGDRCEDTSLIIEAPTTLAASLRHAAPDPELEFGVEAACGLSGPTVFVEATSYARADLHVLARGRAYSARFAVLLPGCLAAPERLLACGETLPVTLTDIGPDVELLIAVGVDADDPVLELPVPEHKTESSNDPLDFELSLAITPVLAEHARCGPAFGRCEAGSVCLAELEQGVLVDRCRRPPADSCVAPGTLVVPGPGAAASVEIPLAEPHSDAHEHDCTGWRRPERVERLELPPDLGPDATLTVSADDPRVGLALRGPSCLSDDALACAPAIGVGPSNSLVFADAGTLAGFAAAGESPLLFIELPRPDDDAEPGATIEISVELVE